MLYGTYDIFLVLSLFYFLQVPPRAVAPGHEFAAPPPVTPLDLTGQSPLRHPPRTVPTSVPSMSEPMDLQVGIGFLITLSAKFCDSDTCV